jgi:hypothetical protein
VRSEELRKALQSNAFYQKEALLCNANYRYSLFVIHYSLETPEVYHDAA